MDIFNIYLPVAGIEFNVLLLIIIGFCVGVLGGFFGVGGGWIVTPALNIFGFHMAFAIGTDLSNIFGQSIGAVKKHQKMGNIDWKLGLISIITSIIGLEIGSEVIIALEKAGDAGIIVRWCYMLLLSSLGIYMLYDFFVVHPRQLKQIEEELKKNPGNKVKKIERSKISEKLHKINIPPMISFPASEIDSVSIWIIFLIFLFTGFLSGFLGVGGGFIIMPALVYLIGLPTAVAVGTSLITVLFSGAYGCFTYAMKGRVELIAAFIMLIGASIGAQIGSTAIKYVKGYGIRLLFSIMIIFAALSVATEQFYKLTMKQLFQTFAGIVLIGTALTMSAVIISKLIIESRKEK
ncbi:MAG: sulfite exporter TauE/SafE family protein [Ignavibacteriaceae bacterium]